MPPLLECLPYIGVTSVTRGTVCTLHRVNIYAGSVDWGTYNGRFDRIDNRVQKTDQYFA